MKMKVNVKLCLTSTTFLVFLLTMFSPSWEAPIPYAQRAHAQTITRNLLQRAQDALQTQNYQKAVELYLELWAETRDPNTLFNISIIKYKQKRYEEAQEYLKRYIDVSKTPPNDPQVSQLSQRLSAKIAQRKKRKKRKKRRGSSRKSNRKKLKSQSGKSPQKKAVKRTQVQRTPDQKKSDPTLNSTAQISKKTPLPSTRNEVTHQTTSGSLKPILYSVSAVGILGSIGLYLSAHQTWKDSEGGDYLTRFNARSQAKTLSWSGDALMVTSVAVLVYTLFASSEDVPPDLSARYQLSVTDRSLGLQIVF